VVTPARRCAYEVTGRVLEEGAYADRAFRAQAERQGLSGRERALAMRLTYGTIQRKATLDQLIELFSGRPPENLDRAVRTALRLGLYQITYLEGVADHAAVTESVELAKQARSAGHGLVNAVLRRATVEAKAALESLPDATPGEAAVRHSHPRWIAERWWQQLGPTEALALMKRDNEPAESAARANTLRATADDVVAALASEGVEARRDSLFEEAVVLEQAYDLHGSLLFAAGKVMPQSRASMLVAHAVDPQPGERVLDLCSAPGAKTTHLAALMRNEGRVVAVDIDAKRVQAVMANCDRLGVTCAEARVGDAREPVFGEGYDGVLIDPPCSDLGTLQSRPDVRWQKQPAQVEELRRVQGAILEAGARAVRPGGRLVYATCTISADENERQIEAFLDRHGDFSAIDLSDAYPEVATPTHGFLQTFPHRHMTDGFFVAALQRRA
jgi:16S rRNA (cytosine967-C5)-methyltransferase